MCSSDLVLLVHLLKWQFQPTHRGSSWEKTIKLQRAMVIRRVQKTPSLKYILQDADWWVDAWFDAVAQAANETGIDVVKFPDVCTWTPEQVLEPTFFPV